MTSEKITKKGKIHKRDGFLHWRYTAPYVCENSCLLLRKYHTSTEDITCHLKY